MKEKKPQFNIDLQHRTAYFENWLAEKRKFIIHGKTKMRFFFWLGEIIKKISIDKIVKRKLKMGKEFVNMNPGHLNCVRHLKGNQFQSQTKS